MSDHITINVDLPGYSYPVHIGSGLLARTKELVPQAAGGKIFILYDRNVEAYASTVAATVYGQDVVCMAIEGGEPTKSFGPLERVVSWMLEHHVDRDSILFVIGGGVVGDLGGFAASIVMRGIRFVQVPTTLLAQVDSSVGGKTGINTAQGKNLVGSFYQPMAVLCDTDTLKTLPTRELKAGYAEVVKYGVIDSLEFYEWLEKDGEKVLALDQSAVCDAVETSCQIKAQIVGGDEREKKGGARALLNFGHTFAHALEAAAGYDGRLLHGEAVSIGMVLALRLSVRMGICNGQDATRIENHLKACGMKTEISQISPALSQNSQEIASLMYHDKKASNGKIGFILAREIGDVFQSSDVDMNDVIKILEQSIN